MSRASDGWSYGGCSILLALSRSSQAFVQEARLTSRVPSTLFRQRFFPWDLHRGLWPSFQLAEFSFRCRRGFAQMNTDCAVQAATIRENQCSSVAKNCRWPSRYHIVRTAPIGTTHLSAGRRTHANGGWGDFGPRMRTDEHGLRPYSLRRSVKISVHQWPRTAAGPVGITSWVPTQLVTRTVRASRRTRANVVRGDFGPRMRTDEHGLRRTPDCNNP